MRKHSANINSILGIGLLELMLSLAVISLLILVSARYFSSAKHGQEQNQLATVVREIIQAANTWGTSAANFTDISMQRLIDANLLPESYQKHSYGGQILITPKDKDEFTFTIKITDLPETVCKSLRSQFADYSINC